MKSENLAMGTVLVFQTAVGILGNFSVLFHYLMPGSTGKSLVLKNLIVKHLALANFLSLISRRIPQIMAEFGMKHFLDDVGCKLILYLYRVSRGISLHATCLLSCFQATTMASSRTSWMKLKHRAIKYMGPSCSLSWFLHLLVNIMIPMRATGPRRNATKSWKLSIGYCSWFVSGGIATPLYIFFLCFTDGLYLCLMSWASVFMVGILYSHKRQVQYIRRARNPLKVSPESRAIQTILTLVCTFVAFYSVSSILLLYSALFRNPELWIINLIAILETCFPMFCPYIVLISSNSSASRHFFLCWWKR